MLFGLVDGAVYYYSLLLYIVQLIVLGCYKKQKTVLKVAHLDIDYNPVAPNKTIPTFPFDWKHPSTAQSVVFLLIIIEQRLLWFGLRW